MSTQTQEDIASMVMWFLLRNRGAVTGAFVRYVGSDSLQGACDIVGREYSAKRCAEAIRQVMDAVK